jgi:hypothetical protein
MFLRSLPDFTQRLSILAAMRKRIRKDLRSDSWFNALVQGEGRKGP